MYSIQYSYITSHSPKYYTQITSPLTELTPMTYFNYQISDLKFNPRSEH